MLNNNNLYKLIIGLANMHGQAVMARLETHLPKELEVIPSNVLRKIYTLVRDAYFAGYDAKKMDFESFGTTDGHRDSKAHSYMRQWNWMDSHSKEILDEARAFWKDKSDECK